jgi:hypothetical protein
MIVRRSTPIDRRITLGPPSDDLPGQLPQMSVEFRNAWGERVQRFDPQQLAALPDDLRALLIDAFREHHAGLALTTRRTAWFALRRFAAFVAQDGSIGAARDVDSAALGRYVIWLHDAGSVSANRRARSRPRVPGSGRQPAKGWNRSCATRLSEAREQARDDMTRFFIAAFKPQ